MLIQLQTALDNASDFIALNHIVRNAKEDISFFGGRYIYAEGYEGYEGYVDIDAIAARFMILQKTHFELAQEERKVGRELSPLITKLYDSNDSRSTNILTRIFCILRDFLRMLYNFFSGQGYGTKGVWSLGGDCPEYFDAYTLSQYLEAFNEHPSGMPQMRCPDRWYPPPNFFSKANQ
jgi:hypothetical protein